jgi:all-trans-retinol 13,14-reductase
METRYDAVVIGSGIGGLAAASLLAAVGGRRVLVLERHFRLGGFTQTFRRGRFTWDVGVHYVGELADGSLPRRLFDLASGGAVGWERMPSPFEVFEYPGLTFEVPDEPSAYREALGAAFPRERRAIDAYFRDVARAAGWVRRWAAAQVLPWPVSRLAPLPGRRHALSTTAEVLDRRFGDPRLRAVVASQWGDYGLPPSQSAFAIHAVVADHYLHGAWYPRGGAGVIAPAMAAVVEAAGGACRVNHTAESILLEGGRVAGVRVHARDRDGERTFDVRAPLVVSDAGARATFERLLPSRARPPLVAGRPEDAASAVTLYLGLRASPAGLGFRGENRWIFERDDHEATFAARNDLARGRAVMAYVSFASLKDPTARAHTAEIVAPLDAEAFSEWRTAAWKRRGDAYEAFKAAIANALLDLVERRHPGFRDLVEYAELSTPLSVEHFTGHARGAIYGAAPTPARFRDPALRARTAVGGLFLAGADACTLGVMGAFMGGTIAAAAALGPSGFPRIVAAAARAPRPPEHAEVKGALGSGDVG